MHLLAESHLACANARIFTGTAELISPDCLSLPRFVSVSYFTRAGSQSPRSRGTQQHAQYRRGHGASILASSRASNPTGVSSPPRRTTRQFQREGPIRERGEGPQLREIVDPALAVSGAPLRSSSSRALRPCHATRRLALQLSCRNRWFVYIDHHRSLMSPPLSRSPIAPYSLLSPKGG